MSGFAGFVRGIGLTRLALIFGVTAGVAAALFFLMTGAGGQQRSLLYAGLEPSDAAQVAQQLDQAGIRYEIEGGGGSIYVARDQVSEARLTVASQGALGSGTVGYELFEKSDALGSTQFVQDLNARRATEGELARTIQSIRGVTSARVHLSLPQRRLFEREAEEAKATVVIGLMDPTAGASHAATIRNLVSTAVPGLQTGRVTVVDEQGRTLANGAGEEGALSAAVMEDQRATTEERLRRKVLDALSPVVGIDGARVQVAADIDLTRVSTSAETFDPDSQVVRSSETVEESIQDRDGSSNQPVSVSGNLPGDAGSQAAGPEGSSSESERLEELINYEISRVTTTEVREAGDIQRLSVAVTVDHARDVAEDGAVSWRPRTEAELGQIAAIARAAVGFNAARGDVVEVTSLPFERPVLTQGQAAPGRFSFSKNDIMRFGEIGVMLIVGLALVILVARPLARGLAMPAPAMALAGGGTAPAVAGPAPRKQAKIAKPQSKEALPAPEGEGGEDAGLEDDEDETPTIDIGQVDGKLKASTIRRISEVVDKHPEESMSIIRTWMHEN